MCAVLCVACTALPLRVLGATLYGEAQLRAALARGTAQEVLVSFEHSATHQWAQSEVRRRGLPQEDAVILQEKSRRFGRSRDKLLAQVAGTGLAEARRYQHLPMVLLRLDAEPALDRLAANPLVISIRIDGRLSPVLDSFSANLVGAGVSAALGFTGAGSTVVFADTGVNYTLADFGFCTAPGLPAGCKVSLYQNIADHSASLDSAGHGTNVAGVAAAEAPDAKIAMYNVFGASSQTSDSLVIAVTDQAILLRRQGTRVSAVNLSLGDGSINTVQCPSSTYSTPVAQALAAGISTVVAAGNQGKSNALSNPACVPGVVSVGAVYSTNWGGRAWAVPCTDTTTFADKVACFSNSANYLTLLAPGALITAGGMTQSGTSQATPFVSGALAVLSAQSPGLSPAGLLAELTSTGVPVTDPRNGLIFPRLNLGQALRPANDLFVNRLALSGLSGALTTSNVNASLESAEPLPVGGASLWWKWVAPAGGQLSLTTQGSTVPTLLGVYLGAAVAALTPVAQSAGDGSAGGAGVLFEATSGAEYQIKVDGAGGATGSLSLAWRLNTTAAADLGVTLDVSPTNAVAGGVFNLNATLSNAGPQAATGVLVSGTLPMGVSLKATPAGCQFVGAALSCALGTVGVGSSAKLALPLAAASAGTFTLKLTVSSDLPDPHPADNAASLPVAVAGTLDANADVPAIPAWGAALLAACLALSLSRRGVE